MNKGILIGRIGKDAETKRFYNGSVKVSFTLATSEYRKDKDGKRVETTDWHNIIMWGERAEKIAPNLLKGKLVCAEGKIKSGRWQEGEQVKYSPFLECNNIEFLSSEKRDDKQQEEKNPLDEKATEDFSETSSDDIPF